MLHMDLFGTTSVRSINHKTYCLITLLPTVFWAEAINTACYFLNRVLVTKPHNKTPYELIIGRPPRISFMRPFRCPVTILNTLDPLGKFDGKSKEGFLVGNSIYSKALRVFNSQTRKVEENLHVNFLENKPNVAGQGPNWLFNIDSLTNSMNYQPVTAGNQTNKNACPQETNGNTDEIDEDDIADDVVGEKPVQKPASENEQALKNVLDKMMDQEKEAKDQSDAVRKEFEAQCNRQNLLGKPNSFNIVSIPVNTASASRIFGDAGSSFVPFSKFTNLLHDPLMLDLEDTAEVLNTGIFSSAYDDDNLDTCNSPYADQVVSAEADFNNMEPSTVVSPIPISSVHSIYPKDQIIRDPRSVVQTRGMTKKSSREHAMISYIQKQRRSNHKDFQNCLFACFLSQQEPTKIAQALDDESWVEAMQEKLLQFKIQKVWTLVYLPYGKKAIDTKWMLKVPFSMVLLKRRYMFANLQVLWIQNFQKKFTRWRKPYMDYTKLLELAHNAPKVPDEFNGRAHFLLGFASQAERGWDLHYSDKYVGEILKKFGFSSIKTASTPMETNKALTKNEDGKDVDVHLYRSMIGSLIYLTSSRPDIMFSVCACSRFQVQPKVSHLNAVKRIFRYLKGQPKLGLWLISWQCKKQTVVANSTTKAEYIAASQCCGQVLWIQNQLLDYGYNFMQIKIHVDNGSAICVVKNPVYHSKTKHIDIRHHFIKDSYDKRLIEMVKIQTDNNVADLLTQAFD
ncbi:ribonuclease H-like domain-containing protein, partial [Tanacetum coccineum]